MPNVPSGIAMRDDRWGIWTGTFVDGYHDAAIEECWRLADEVSGESRDEMARHHARVVEVNLVENEACAATATH